MRTSITLDKTDFRSVASALQQYGDDEIVNIYSSRMDEIEKMIHGSGLRISALHFHKELDLMLIVLNNRKTLQRSISEFTRLNKATAEQLKNYELIGKGSGVHWPDVDEDLSLKGFIRDEIDQTIRGALVA